MDEDGTVDDFVYEKIRSKRKAVYADVYVQVKTRSIAPPPIPIMAESSNEAVDLSHDIWFHISSYIAPEDVQSFALTCRQTAKLVNSRAFWRNLYKRHCGGPSGWNLELPAQLQLEQIRNCDTKVLRSHVIAALFHCHRPLKVRLELGYSLDWLLQRSFVSCWQKQYQCLWVMCYKFCNQQTNLEEHKEMEMETVNDWEALADAPERRDQSSLTVQSLAHRHEGVVILLVLLRHFVPIPTQLSYGQQQSSYRLKATRELLSTNMRAKNLELDFAEIGSSLVSITVKHPRIDKHKVLPWWHPDFKRFVK